MEKIIETKKCTHCGVSFEITDKDLEFYEKVSPVFNGVKYAIPTPTFCPDCRLKRRLSFRNERKLYKRKCEATGKSIISIYSPDKLHKVYTPSEWWSDKWDAMEYGRNFDFSRPFFEQFGELIMNVPQLAILNTENENCDYNNFIKGCKNCYLSSVVYYGSEDVYFSSWIFHSTNILESFDLFDCDNCVECLDSFNLNNCRYLTNCMHCNDSSFCRNCINCAHCYMCVNLNGKKYHIENKEYSKEEYFEKIKEYELKFPTLNEKRKYFYDFSMQFPFPYVNLQNCENCSGDNLSNSKNAHDCYSTSEIEDGKYLTSEKTKNSYDGIGGQVEWSYEFCRVGWGQRNLFCFDEIESNFTTYCWSAYYSNDCFGCVGVRNKKYCIFNKQYTKEEYEELVPKIIEHMKKTGEWGEFFPSSLSPFGYNETVAYEFFPTSKQEALDTGYNWSDYETPLPKVEKIIPASKLPDDIAKIPDDILNWAVECEVTGKPFRIIKQELEFYRKHNLPIPRRHPDQRHLDRMSLRNPRKLFERKCDKCGVEIKTTYSSERPEIVYCESCYEKEVY